MVYNIIIQAIGAIAYILLVGSYYRKEKSKMLSMQIISLLIFSVHFYMLNRKNRSLM